MTWLNKVQSATALARLGVATPEQVCAELKEVGHCYSHEVEQALFKRNNPLINLSLAQYARNSEIISFFLNEMDSSLGRTDYSKGLRLACLANSNIAKKLIIGHESASKLDLTRDEIKVLMGNPSDDLYMGKILSDAYNKSGFFADISDEKLWECVTASIGNPRINLKVDYGPAENDYEFIGIHKGILNLLGTAPVEGRWFDTLYSLLLHIDPAGSLSRRPNISDLDQFNHIMVRWSNYEDSAVSDFQCMIAAKYGKGILTLDVIRDAFEIKSGEEFWFRETNKNKLFIRCVFYGNCSLTQEEIRVGRERDGGYFDRSAIENEDAYRDELRLFWDESHFGPADKEIFRARREYLDKDRCSLDSILKKQKEVMTASEMEERINFLTDKVNTQSIVIIFSFVVIVAIIVFFKS